MPKEDPFVNRAQLLKAIKKYPEIWDSNNKLHMCRSVTAPMWNEIAEQFGGHVPTVKLQSIWSQMKYHYHNLVHRQVLHKERFTTKWEHFEPMSFMYNITVAKIVGASQQQQQQQAATSSTATTSLNANALPPQQLLQTSSMLPVLPAQTHHGRGRPSGSFTWLPHAASSSTPTPNSSNQTAVSAMPLHAVTPIDVSNLVSTNQATSAFIGFSGLVPPAAAHSVQTDTTLLRKPGRPGSMNNSMRARIIDAIKQQPILWEGRQREQRQGQNRTSAVWKELAANLGLTPSLVQTRWSIIKQRFVDELQKERHAMHKHQIFNSSWEHFERMSFMRAILDKKVDEREQTREHIQEIVSEQQQLQAQHMRFARHTLGIPTAHLTGGQLVICEDVIGLEEVHDAVARARVKSETDLEWDPFDMIMHVPVHGVQTNTN